MSDSIRLQAIDQSLFDRGVTVSGENPDVAAMDCADRANNGYQSGMGQIFRKIAELNPISSSR